MFSLNAPFRKYAALNGPFSPNTYLTEYFAYKKHGGLSQEAYQSNMKLESKLTPGKHVRVLYTPLLHGHIFIMFFVIR